MPIRPRDFDGAPTPPTAEGEPVAGRIGAIDKQARAKQEREMFASATRGRVPRGLRWAVAAVAIALAVFTIQKPLGNLFTSLARTPEHTPSDPPSPYSPPPEQTVNPRGRASELKPETPPPASKDPLHAGSSESDPLRKTPSGKPSVKREPQYGTGSNSPRVRKESAAIQPQNDPSQELIKKLQRQQEELELRNEQLAEAQKAIEAQKLEDAQAAARAAEQAKRDLEAMERAKPKEPSAGAHHQAPYLGPSSGTLVWEGPVDGADLIEIQDGSSNRGSVSGTLPGVPVMVQAFPANAVTIAVAPSPSNAWRRIVLRVKAKGVKKVTVRWALP